MMHNFTLLERGREARHAIQQELVFKVYGRRNQLFCQWAANAMGLEGRSAITYVREILDHVFGETDANRLLARVGDDLNRCGLRYNEAALLEKLYEIEGAACGVVMSEINGNVVVPFRRTRAAVEREAQRTSAALLNIDSALKRAKAAPEPQVEFRDVFMSLVHRRGADDRREAAE